MQKAFIKRSKNERLMNAFCKHNHLINSKIWTNKRNGMYLPVLR